MNVKDDLCMHILHILAYVCMYVCMWCVSICLQRTHLYACVCISDCTSVYECVQNVCGACARGGKEEKWSAHLLFESLSLVHRVCQLGESVRMLSSDLQRRGRERMRGGDGMGKGVTGDDEGRGKIEINRSEWRGCENKKLTKIQNHDPQSLTMNISNLSTMPFLLLWGFARGDTYERKREAKKKQKRRIKKIDNEKICMIQKQLMIFIEISQFFLCE
jgi:hypothetical protein